LALAAAAGLLLFCAGCRRGPAGAEAAAVEVRAIRVSTRAIPDEITAAGAIEAVQKADVGFLVAGRVLEVSVEDGTDVIRGQLLARLDPADYQQRLAIAEASLAEVRARHERLTRMHDLGSLTASDFDRIESALKEAESGAELARRQLAYTELRAPFDGQAVRSGIAVGQAVVPAVPVFTVLAPAPVWANVGVAEGDAHRVRAGQSVRVVLPSAGDRLFAGTVETVLPQAEPLSRSFTVKILLDNADHLLHPGNVVTARIATGTIHHAVTLPPEAVQRYPDGALFAWTVDPQRHTAARQIIETGQLRGDVVEVTSGLKPGDVVVTSVPLTLFEGMALRADVTP
jgi:RND family efflux transporter MFP subunit